MKKYLGVALGIIAALGGFVDIGELVFNTQAGALFGYRTLWAIVVGVIVSVVLAELSGRVAIVAKKATFDLVRGAFSWATPSPSTKDGHGARAKASAARHGGSPPCSPPQGSGSPSSRLASIPST